MKEKIHPKYEKTTISCACGAVYEVGTTKKGIKVEVCANCHPFYTGSRSLVVERGGRVERFKKKFGTDYTKADGK
ncbi:MAG: 50S ribosomal protein L31 [Bacillota bacterium]